MSGYEAFRGVFLLSENELGSTVAAGERGEASGKLTIGCWPCGMDLPGPEIEPGSPSLQADSLPTELSGKPKEGVI